MGGCICSVTHYIRTFDEFRLASFTDMSMSDQ